MKNTNGLHNQRRINVNENSLQYEPNSIFILYTGKRYAFTEKQRYDGWFNNLAHPDWGTVGK